MLHHICSGGVRHSWVLGTPHFRGTWINPYKGIPVNVSLFSLSLARSTTNNGHSFIVTRQPVIGTKILGCLHVWPRTSTAVSSQQRGNNSLHRLFGKIRLLFYSLKKFGNGIFASFFPENYARRHLCLQSVERCFYTDDRKI